jgi:CRISPR-associated protein Csm3
MAMKRLYKKLFFEGTLECLTGLHIGDSKDSVEIGGLDGPVVRRKDNNQPYIPGSSIKGKMRSLLQQAFNQATFEATADKDIAYFFGAADSRAKKPDSNEPLHKGHGSYIIFRDAYLTKDSADILLASEYTDMPYTEQKYENSIDRATGTTSTSGGGMRNQERVPAGAMFKVEFVINVVGENDEEAKSNETFFKSLFNIGIELLNKDYLGGSGSRGYGHVNIILDEPTFIDYSEKMKELAQ